MKIIMFTSVLNNIMFMNTMHPLFLTILTISQSLLMCVFLYMILNHSWLTYVLFLIFLGGMMILFAYVCSLASNESIKNKTNKTMLTSTIVLTMFMTMTLTKINQTQMKYNMSLIKIFNKMMMTLTMLIMIYMLLTLIISVKNMSLDMGPLRTKKMK